MSAKETLTEWLADGDLERVISGLRIVNKRVGLKDLASDINFQSGRYQDLKNNHLKGLVSHADYSTELAKIRQSLFEIVGSLAEHWTAEGLEMVPNSDPGKRQQRPRMLTCSVSIAFAMIFVAILAITVEYFFASKDDSFQLTVYVHGPKSQSDVVLQNTGKLLITLDNDRRSAMIGENGRTNFGEIPAKFKGQEIPIGLEAEGYELAFPDKEYKINGEPVYLEVHRDQTLGLVQGIVKDRSGERFIAGALVMIDHDTTVTTDSLGRFRLVLPPAQQRETYSLTVKKDGFKTKAEYYKPKSGKIEIRLEK